MNIPLDEVIYFDCITTHPSTGAATDADSTPTFAIYEESTDTDIGVGGNLTKRTSLTGNYRGSATLSAANGFEVGKWYSIIGSATVNAIAGKAVLRNFRVCAAEAIAGKAKVDVDALLGTAWLTPGTAGTPDVNVKLLSGDATAADNAESFFDGTGYAGTNNVIPTVTTLTGHTAQTGDVYALANGVNGFVAIKGDTAAIGSDTAALLVDTGSIETKLDTVDGVVDAILVDTAEIGAAGAGLTALASQASVNTIDDFLDTEVAAIKVWTDRLGTAMEVDGGVYRFTTNALEQSPAGGGGAGAQDVLEYDITGDTPADVNCLTSAVRFILNKKAYRETGGSYFIDVYKEDGTTVAFSLPVTLQTGPVASPVATGSAA